jgi:hypothetical protein
LDSRGAESCEATGSSNLKHKILLQHQANICIV